MSTRLAYRFALSAALVVAALTSSARSATPPATGPTIRTTPANDVAEVARLTDVGLPTRAFLNKAWADRATQWRAADAAGDADAAFLLASCSMWGIGAPADPAAAARQFDEAIRRGSAPAATARALLRVTDAGLITSGVDGSIVAVRRAADGGDLAAMSLVSEFYEHGVGVPHDPALALKWAQRAVEAGSRHGLVRLADIYQGGVGLPTDPAMAVQCLRRAADTGSVEALVQLGNLCTKADRFTDAAAWYRRAADAGDPRAMIDLAMAYHSDRLGPPDPVVSRGWLDRAAATGDPDALLYLARSYAKGWSPLIMQDAKRAFTFYRQSVDAGGYDALGPLGRCYLNGAGTGKDPRLARLYLQRGADAGESNCMADLSRSYWPHEATADPDPALTLKWAKRSAELGNADGMNLLAICYVKEIGTPFDATQAMRWFRRSAELGNVEAMNSVGLRYERGEGGVTKDLATAFKWYALAADHGDLNGMTNTANCCAAGTGTPVDGPRAERLYLAAIRRFVLPADRQKLANAEFSLACLYVNPKANVLDPTRAIVAAERAAANGNPKAWAVLGSAAGHGVGLPKDPPAAFGYYRKGAEAGDPLAMLGLGQCYQSGIGCAMDFGEANVWYTKAANAGSTDAMVELGIMHVQGTPTDADFQAAAAWYRKAADLGSALATGNLAILMANGQGMPQDPETALVLARKAEAAGQPHFVARVADVYLRGVRAVPMDVPRGTALLQEAADHGDVEAKAKLAALSTAK